MAPPSPEPSWSSAPLAQAESPSRHSSSSSASPTRLTLRVIFLLSVPNLKFQSKTTCFSPRYPEIASLEAAEGSRMKVVAIEGLRDNFVGLYDARSAVGKINDEGRRILEQLAVARTNGVPQCQLAKEFQMNWKRVFYIVNGI